LGAILWYLSWLYLAHERFQNTKKLKQKGGNMSEPFIGEIKMFGFNYAPSGWALCDGQVLPIEQNYSLYALLGTAYGGDGQTTFALPDMRGRVPVHMGPGYYRGDKGGYESVPLDQTQLPMHTHAVMGTTAAGDSAAGTATASFATSSGGASIYGEASGLVNMENGVIDPFEGGGHPHNNVQPIQVINFCIAMDGLFPARS
jgi:microcystin-dependent protein